VPSFVGCARVSAAAGRCAVVGGFGIRSSGLHPNPNGLAPFASSPSARVTPDLFSPAASSDTSRASVDARDQFGVELSRIADKDRKALLEYVSVQLGE
jgi:hypothetical protein